ncbi:homocysteine S-methyltransferase family protein [Candidatus Thiodiazotropha sp. CDECU1]|uniref:homocysteine S-methyltransferase family protein n=1 Tax=Candidatus Thiodiazotropha sp. CDECU1 TaxID=3065865 RepID=UPI00292D0909|nr:homocysteine S-methyltransferase family protein [Candidatus Thiodiazotropha sp. CDECU1]
MNRTNARLPQLASGLFLTDGGIETTLIFHDGFDLPHFAAFDLLRNTKGRQALTDYYKRYLSIAIEEQLGFILETPTWRASVDWGEKIGYTEDDIKAVNEDAVYLMRQLAEENRNSIDPLVISGCIGPRGDGYDAGDKLTVEAAESYHDLQIEAFKRAGADQVTAITMTHMNEALGIVKSAMKHDIPVAISFTLETDGRLPSGTGLKQTLTEIDKETGCAPAYYMINCAHPTHFDFILPQGEAWVERIHGIRANASCRSHKELDEAPDLDIGNPEELGMQYRDLIKLHPQLNILGGCCGTDHRHIKSISKACRAVARSDGNEINRIKARKAIPVKAGIKQSMSHRKRTNDFEYSISNG